MMMGKSFPLFYRVQIPGNELVDLPGLDQVVFQQIFRKQEFEPREYPPRSGAQISG
jgi:hypothetical protein